MNVSLSDVIKTRRSVRAYLDKPVEDKLIEEIVEAARLAPSACNSQPWRFVVVTDKDIKNRITEKVLNGIFLPNTWAKTAPVIIAVCAELSFVPHTAASNLKRTKLHLLDIGIAIEQLVLKATELGLGTCIIGWFNGKTLRKLLNIPNSIQTIALITLGYPEEPLTVNQKEKLPLEKILFWNKYK
ncbi:MAG: nitroreductase family protein [bacterium]|nr:nitroreductase family protein [bacterium]